MKLATQNQPFFPERWKDKLNFVKSLGFEAFEIDGRALIDQFEEIKRAVRDVGLHVRTACGGYGGWIGHFEGEKRQKAIQDIGEILVCLSKISAKGIVVPAAWGMFSKRLPPMVPPRSEEEDRNILLDSLDKINRVAENTGTYLLLEPLNRYEDYMINRLSDAAQLIRAGSFGHVKIAADFFHMNIEESHIEESIRDNNAFIGHIHLSDSHRYEPGSGHMDFTSAFKALKEIGYSDDMAFECRVLGENPEAAYRKSLSYIRSCMDKA